MTAPETHPAPWRTAEARVRSLEEALTIAIAHIERSGGPRDSYTDAAIERVVRDLRAAMSTREEGSEDAAPRPGDAMTAPERILPPWEDENVQRVYRMLWWESVPTPPSDEHWEGWIARHIVADLYAEKERLERERDDAKLAAASLRGELTAAKGLSAEWERMCKSAAARVRLLEEENARLLAGVQRLALPLAFGVAGRADPEHRARMFYADAIAKGSALEQAEEIARAALSAPREEGSGLRRHDDVQVDIKRGKRDEPAKDVFPHLPPSPDPEW